MRPANAVEHRIPPDAPLPDGPPDRAGITGEWRSALQVGRLAAHTPRLVAAPRGRGLPVLLVPGWRAPEASMAPLRAYLRWLGHDARHWGFGVNEGDPERDSRRLAARLQRLTGPTGPPVAIVGWSLGGTVARETARLVPDAVQQVITYGTPAVGGPRHTIGAGAYGSAETMRISHLVDRMDAEDPIRVPVTAVFTRRDAVVSWTACIDRRSPDVRHVEVGSTHFSMGIDPDVWLTVARRLADPAR